MNIQLLIILIIFTFFSWIIYNKDFFAPPVIVGMIFSFISYCSLFLKDSWNFSLHLNTFKVLVLGILSIQAGCVFCRIINIKKRDSNSFFRTKIEHIIVYNYRCLLFMSTLIFVIGAIGIINVARKAFTAESISGLIYAYRLNSLSSSEYLLPSITSNLILINYAIGYIAIYIMINNYYVGKRLEKRLIPFIIYPMITSLLQGARGNLVHYLLFSIVIFYYYYLLKKQKKYIDSKFVLKLIVILLVAVYLFYALKNVIGRQNNSQFIEYIGNLLCAPMKLLDVYLQENHPISSIWGTETFTNLISRIRNWKGMSGIKYRDYANYRVIKGIHLGNVYTAFRAYYADFRYVGVVICSAVIGIITGGCYEKFHRNERKKIINDALFMYAYLVYGLAMLFYSNTFYEYVFNVSFVKIIIVWFVVNYIFIYGKIRFI